MGLRRRTRSGLWSIWARCPLEIALRLRDEGKIRIGWSYARVEMLKKRPLQCFKCLAVGHTQGKCPAEADRRMACFNCGNEGHKANTCKEKARCPVCEEWQLPANHRAGSETCRPVPPRGGSPGLTGAASRGAARGDREAMMVI